jgi:lipopolysaccharide transport system permease protein
VAAALALQTAAVFGLGLAAAPLGTLYPDLRPALTSVMTVLVFASPIVYPEGLLSPGMQAALEWNPFTHLLRLYRAPLVVGGAPATGLDVALAAAAAAALVAAGQALKARLRWAARDRL